MTAPWYDWVVPSRARLARRWRRGPERPWVLGHRGARHAAPENSMAAFDLAMDEGADGVEFDVRLDGSGRVIVLHDPTPARVTQGAEHQAVESMTATEVDALDVGGGQRIPLLDAVLDWARARNAAVNVEVKSDVSNQLRLVRRVAEILAADDDAPERVLLSSFHPGFVAGLSRRLPSVAVAWLIHDRQRFLRHMPMRRFVGPAAVHPQATMITARTLRRWKAAGLTVNTWTVNDPNEARRLAALGVDALISDAPGRILSALGSG
jgi:glycerophosphoryl diester phosphodiesterase